MPDPPPGPGTPTEGDAEFDVEGFTFSSGGSVTSGGGGGPPSVIDGQLLKTLADITLSSEGEVSLIGDFSDAVDAISLSSEGEVTNSFIAGTLTKVLDPITLLSFAVTQEDADLSVTLDNILLSAELIISPKGGVDSVLDSIILSSSGVAPNRSVLDKTLDDILLSSFAVPDVDADLDETIIITLSALAEGTGSSHFDQEIILEMTSEGESSRIGASDTSPIISLESVVETSIEGNLSVTIEDIVVNSNDFSGDSTLELVDIGLSASGGIVLEAEFSKVITLSFVSTARPSIQASLTEILDDVILLQVHNLPSISDYDNSPFLDSCPSTIIGETDATICSRS